MSFTYNQHKQRDWLFSQPLLQALWGLGTPSASQAYGRGPVVIGFENT
jgi:hypothetical protein